MDLQHLIDIGIVVQRSSPLDLRGPWDRMKTSNSATTKSPEAETREAGSAEKAEKSKKEPKDPKKGKKDEKTAAISLEPPSGTRDFFPEDMRLQSWLFTKFRETASLFGFQEYDAPVLEHEELYKRKAGEEITQQMYNFVDKDGAAVTLRPEMTPSLARMVLSLMRAETGEMAALLPLKWYSIPQCWRFETTQRGRKREHYQWNMDIVGVSSVYAEAELLAAVVRFFESAGITSKDVGLKVNSRKVLGAVLKTAGVPDARFAETCIIIDKQDKIGAEEVRKELVEKIGLTEDVAKKIIAATAARSLDEFADLAGVGESEEVKELRLLFSLAADYGYGDWVQFDASVVRGLAYYTGVVFEGFDRAGVLRAICGGGRYDRLLSLYGSVKEVPCCGFGFGDCVIVELLKEKKVLPDLTATVDFVVAAFNQEMMGKAMSVAQRLRKAGKTVDVFLEPGKKVGKAFNYADRVGAVKIAFVAPDEWEKGLVRIKDLRNFTAQDLDATFLGHPVVTMEVAERRALRVSLNLFLLVATASGQFLPLHSSSRTAAGDRSLAAKCPTSPAAGALVTAAPLCSSCAALSLPNNTCMYDVSSCGQVTPGSSCQIRCAPPYTGSPTMATCPQGNSDATSMLLYTLPNCSCPEPQAQQGYIKASDGTWQCADGYSGQPSVGCQSAPNCTGVWTYLQGCNQIVACKPPSVDQCRYDISQCANVQPGGNCTIKCKPPLTGGVAVATCPLGNTNPNKVVSYFPLDCALSTCADPPVWPAGYNKTADGQWTCATGYNGVAVNRCAPGPTWTQDCGALSVLSGCSKIINCQMPMLTGTDACQYDLQSCLGVAPGGTCIVKCKAPFIGSSKDAFCPDGNTDPNGLQVNYPTCNLLSCDDPAVVPNGYKRSGSSWMCDNAFTGYAVKTCVAVPGSCAVAANLSGCAQLVPCSITTTDCRFDTYACASVLPGSSCKIGCKVPFAGTTSSGACPLGNTAPGGLVWRPPTCALNSCADPLTPPTGYQQSKGIWTCAPGWTGTVQKVCQWNEVACSNVPLLSGCSQQAPCSTVQLDDTCAYNFTDCQSVPAGGACSVYCQAPRKGPSSVFTCPANNTVDGTPVEGTLPACGCGDPVTLPSAYVRTSSGYSCAPGYAGTAQKSCQSGPNCTVAATLVGCFAPVTCAAQTFMNAGQSKVTVLGTVKFGVALQGTKLSQDNVTGYAVYFADSCNQTLGQALGTVPPLNATGSCCRTDALQLSLTGVPIPAGAQGLLVVVVTDSGNAPVGRFVPFGTASLMVTMAGTFRASLSLGVLWLVLLLSGFH